MTVEFAASSRFSDSLVKQRSLDVLCACARQAKRHRPDLLIRRREPPAVSVAVAECGPWRTVHHRPNRGRAGRQGPGALRFTPCANMSARTHGPRLPRGNEACRSRIVPAVGSLQSLGRARRKSAGFPGVPRAVFIGLLRKEPRKSSASPVVRRDLPTRTRPASRASDRRPPGSSGSSAPTSQARGALRLGPPGPSSASPLQGKLPGHRSPPRVWRR